MDQGIVIYSDGGARPVNPGPAGWGIHGYLYLLEEPKKPIPGFDYFVTRKGYVGKADLKATKKVTEVTPVHYVNGYGSVPFIASNNVAELLGAINAFRHALAYDIKELQLFTDSEYVVKGLEIYADVWAKNNWLRKDGTPPANVQYWKELVFEKEQLLKRGVELSYTWVKGHTDKITNLSDNLGNIIADKLATVGVLGSIRQEFITSIETTAAEGYWKYEVDKHPLISNRSLYFNTLKEYINPGEYYLGEHGKEDDMLGKKISDGAYSVVFLTDPDPHIECIRNYQVMLADNSDKIMMLRLDQMYKSDIHRDISMFGAKALEQPNKNRLDLFCLNREPLTRELNPPKLAMRAVDCVSDLSNKLRMYKDNSPLLTATNITDILYEVEEKVKKKKGSEDEVTRTLRLKNQYNVGFASLPITVNYKLNNEIKQTDIVLTLGIDLVDRNTLKRIETMNPVVTVITWNESSEIIRYATIIETDNAFGIWCGYYSNTCYISINNDQVE